MKRRIKLQILVIVLLAILIPPYAVMIWNISYPPGYLQSGEATGNIHNMILIYGGKDRSWPSERYDPYVGYLDSNLEPIDFFFDGFLYIYIYAQSGRSFIQKVGSKTCAIKEDWEWLLDKIFENGGYLDNLRDSLNRISSKLSKNLTIKVVFTIPYPDKSVSEFGSVSGKNLNFGSDSDRLSAVDWFIGEIMSKFSAKNFNKISLAGFYWLREEIYGFDIPLVNLVNNLIHSYGLKSYWIPYYFAPGVSSWRELGFDCVAYQPNYFFYFWADPSRVHQAAMKANRYGMGVEMEVDGNVISRKDEYYSRYEAYLDGAVEDEFSKGFMAYYQSVDTLQRLSESDDSELRSLYDKTYNISRNNW